MIKKILATVFLVVVPVALLAQTPAKAGHKAKRQTASRVEIKSTATQMASGIMAADAALTPAEMAIAGRIHQGKLPCELGAFVTLTADAKSPGYFEVLTKTQKFRMFPVVTSTGAIRLEDQQAGAVWLQLSNKSMLMSQKLGQRLADECMSPDQAVVAAMMIKNPPPSLLDAPIAVAPGLVVAPIAVAPSLLDAPIAVAPGLVVAPNAVAPSLVDAPPVSGPAK